LIKRVLVRYFLAHINAK